MGMFDTVSVNCPHCSGEIEIQTKDGPCVLANYTLNDLDIPIEVLRAVSNSPEECYHCHKHFIIDTKINYNYTCVIRPCEEDDEG